MITALLNPPDVGLHTGVAARGCLIPTKYNES